MKSLYTKTLPCLQTIGPWWTESDRRTLFCYLLKIFPFDAEYLEALPAANFLENGEQRHLAAIEIKSEFDSFCNSTGRTKCTCPNIRKLRFSFGKLNPKVCFLCPYSSSYKNQHINYEFGLISMRLQNLDLDLSFDVPDPDADHESIFHSFFPIYVDDILIDAQPFFLFAHRILKKENPGISFMYEDYLSYACVTTKSDITQRIQYLRIKDHIFSYYPDYQRTLLSSVDRFLSNFNSESIKSPIASTTSIKELYDQLLTLQSKKYIPADPSEFYSNDLQAYNISLLDYYSFEDSLISSAEITELKKINTNIATTTDEQKIPDVLPEDSLSSYMNDDYYTQPTLDDNVIAIVTHPTNTLPEHSGLSVHTYLPAENTQCCNNSACDSEFIHFKEFYEYRSDDNTYIFETENSNNSIIILNAFVENSEYLCMEPVIHDGYRKLLILSSSGDKLLYSIEDSGPKPIRMIADQSLTVYSSCCYFLNLYLIRNKITKMMVHDIAIAYSLSKNDCVQGLASFPGTNLNDYMLLYHSIYTRALNELTESGLERLSRFEHYSSLLCSDGTSTLFNDLDRLCYGFELHNFKYAYTPESKPNQAGIFHWISVEKNNAHFVADTMIMLYMDTCIALNQVCPFSAGHIHILKLDENGMLLYITGNHYTTQTIQQYLLTYIRRCFASSYTHQKALVIEEKITHSQV